MAKIKYKTLTHMHIGSGRLFKGNFEYLYFASEKNVAIIDEHKVMDIIGEDNIDKWVSIIEREESLLTYVNQRKSDISADDIAQRKMKVLVENFNAKKDIREQLHSGNSKPLLPGSSIKGAIRTYILDELIAHEVDFIKKPENLSFQKKDFRSGEMKTVYSDKKINQHFFGDDPKTDFMKLLRIGDVHFEKTICLLGQVLNQRGENLMMKNEVEQYIECIPEGSESIGIIQIPEKLLKEINKRNFISAEKLEYLNLKKIFRIINENIKKIIETEISYYEEDDMPSGAENLVETYQRLLDQVNGCKDNECVLRIGFGSGYLFITGDWQLDSMDEETYKDLKNSLRSERYKDYEFPKSRKVTQNGNLLGFVKLSIED